jgi:hypothetical protein
MNVNWTCWYYRKELSLMAADCLGESARLQKHLACCPRCAGELARLRKVASGLAQWKAEPVEPSAACHFRLHQALRAAETCQQQPAAGFAISLRWKKVGWGALAAIWVLVLFFNLDAPKITIIAERSQPVSPRAILTVLRSKDFDMTMKTPEPLPPSAPQPPQSLRRAVSKSLLDA